MGLFDLFFGKKRKEEKEAQEFLSMLIKHQAECNDPPKVAQVMRLMGSC